MPNSLYVDLGPLSLCFDATPAPNTCVYDFLNLTSRLSSANHHPTRTSDPRVCAEHVRPRHGAPAQAGHSRLLQAYCGGRGGRNRWRVSLCSRLGRHLGPQATREFPGQHVTIFPSTCFVVLLPNTFAVKEPYILVGLVNTLEHDSSVVVMSYPRHQTGSDDRSCSQGHEFESLREMLGLCL